MNDSDFDKEIDLHESEWKRTGKREPVLGPNGVSFICFCIGAVPAIYFAKFIVDAIG